MMKVEINLCEFLDELEDKKKLNIIEDLFDSLKDDWQSEEGDSLISHLAFTKLTDDGLNELIGILVSRYPEKVIEQTRYWNTESVEVMGYHKVNEKDFLDWLEKKYANCYVTTFASDDIESKIKEFIIEMDGLGG